VTVQDEQTHFQRLDEMKLKHENQQKLAQIAATAEVEKQRIQLQREKLAIWKMWQEPLQVMLAVAGAVGLVFGVIYGIWYMWAQSPPDTPEEMKQDRATACVYDNGKDDGKHDHIWWPDAAGGQGLCLPKDQKPPEAK
jgi:hypothetical protein